MTHHWLGQGQISLSLLDLYLLLHPGMPPLFYDSFMIFYDLRIFMILDNFTNFIPTWPFSNLYFMHLISYASLSNAFVQ